MKGLEGGNGGEGNIRGEEGDLLSSLELSNVTLQANKITELWITG